MNLSSRVCLAIRDADANVDHAALSYEGTATGRYAKRGDVVSLTEKLKERPTRCGCALCPYYDPERAYCLYVDTPVTILFACPRFLDL